MELIWLMLPMPKEASKLINLPDLADDRDGIPFFKGIIGGELHVRLLAVLDGDDVDAVDLAQIQRPHTLAQHPAAHRDAPHLDAVAEGDVVQQIARDQPLADAHGHVGLRVDDLGPETLEHLAVHLTGGLGDDVRHAQLCDEHRRQDTDIDLLTDADRDRAAVLHAGFLQRGLVQLVDDKRIVGVAAHGLDLCLVLVHGNDLLAGGGQRLD